MSPRLQVLRKTRETLEEGTPFICSILSRISAHEPDLCDAAFQLLAEIQQGISHEATLGIWLAKQLGLGHLDYRNMPEPYCNLRSSDWLAQLCRLAWIDRMIADIEEQL